MDSYRTISAPSSGTYTEKRSRFLAFAFPVATPEDVKIFVDEYQKKYYDARHVCYAYMIGAERTTFRANDNGEPSGTAGKPILGQINSNELTNILIIVVRYFGGIKLGTPGLIQAYRTAAAEAIANAQIIEKTIEATLTLTFDYPLMNPVMKVLKEFSLSPKFQDSEIPSSPVSRPSTLDSRPSFPSSPVPSPKSPVPSPSFPSSPVPSPQSPVPSPSSPSSPSSPTASLSLSVRLSQLPQLKSKLSQIYGLTITE